MEGETRIRRYHRLERGEKGGGGGRRRGREWAQPHLRDLLPFVLFSSWKEEGGIDVTLQGIKERGRERKKAMQKKERGRANGSVRKGNWIASSASSRCSSYKSADGRRWQKVKVR